MSSKRNLRLLHAILDSGLEHRQIAAAAHVTDQHFSGVCSGRVRPSKALRARIALALGKPEHELFDDEQVSA